MTINIPHLVFLRAAKYGQGQRPEANRYKEPRKIFPAALTRRGANQERIGAAGANPISFHHNRR